MRITLSTIVALGLLGLQAVSAKKNKKKNASSHLDIDWISEHLGTRRGYPTHTVPKRDKILNEYNVEQYQLIKRHGTRYPGDGDIEAITDLLAKLNGTSSKLTKWVEGYKNQYISVRAGLLDTHGQEEHYSHGMRFAKKYPDILEKSLSGDTVQFVAYSSWSSRTSQSGHAFLMGAYKGHGKLDKQKMMAIPMFSYPYNADTMLAFHKPCKRWQATIDQLTKSYVAPLERLYMQPIADRLSEEININITTKDVKTMFSACGFEVTMHNTKDTFCKMFTKKDLLKLEYYDDLAHWRKLSYGVEDLNGGMACNLAKEIVNNIDKAVNGSRSGTSFPHLDLKFGHDETLLPLRTFFGLYKDNVTLAWNSSQEVIDHRNFRLSDFSFFANNLAFEVLSPKKKNKKNFKKNYYVRVLDNERPIVFPGCSHEVCPYEQFRTAVDPLLNCNYDKICSLQ
ncbi:histidine phosphatase superfamily [Cokeromyces recurvatus]|uniref:histidine phosphatase superfamily n=1 Tax=Cokeromyces recurvatus TaxID=90255 RepID=UPI00221EAF10|nr:histidine phosphatase superfamily [Cokeromyces recurvatus]KAI7903071.1 histidine phosphatase superfamily [Cokeromyces recurvatus]